MNAQPKRFYHEVIKPRIIDLCQAQEDLSIMSVEDFFKGHLLTRVNDHD